MINITIFIGDDGPYYPSKVECVPSVGEYIELTSYKDQKDKLDKFLSLEVVKVIHELIEIDKMNALSIKENPHHVMIICKQLNSIPYQPTF